MSDIHTKKLLILYILDILQKYTDEEHRLSQKEIQDILKKEYEMPVDRKAIKRNLLNLIEYGSSIEYREVSRKEIFRKKSVVSDEDSLDLEDKGIPEDDLLWTDFYLNRINRAVQCNFFPPDQDFSACWLQQSVEHIHHCRFSCTVFTYNTFNLLFFYIQINMIICDKIVKLFGQINRQHLQILQELR